MVSLWTAREFGKSPGVLYTPTRWRLVGSEGDISNMEIEFEPALTLNRYCCAQKWLNQSSVKE
jgi:hypothetical protein